MRLVVDIHVPAALPP